MQFMAVETFSYFLLMYNLKILLKTCSVSCQNNSGEVGFILRSLYLELGK